MLESNRYPWARPRRMSQPRVLSVIETLGLGGAERALLNTLPALQAAGFGCEVAALWPPYGLATGLEAAGIRVHRLAIRSRRSLLAASRAVAHIVRERRFDIVHAHVFSAAVAVALLRFFGPSTKRVVTFHNLGYDSYPANTTKRRLVKTAFGLLMRQCIHRHVAVSRAVAEHYDRHLRLENITVIHNCVPSRSIGALPKRERSAILAGYGLDPRSLVCVMPARFVHEKGHRFLLQAVELLRAKGVAAQVLLIGEGPLARPIEAEVKSRGLGQQIRVLPAMAQGQLLSLVAAADVLVMASTHEGFPLVPAEAMLLRVPVLATRVGGVPELIVDGTSGLLVEPGDPAALADGLARLAADPELRRRLGEAGRREASRFSLDAQVPRWIELYSSLCASSVIPQHPALQGGARAATGSGPPVYP